MPSVEGSGFSEIAEAERQRRMDAGCVLSEHGSARRTVFSAMKRGSAMRDVQLQIWGSKKLKLRVSQRVAMWPTSNRTCWSFLEIQVPELLFTEWRSLWGDPESLRFNKLPREPCGRVKFGNMTSLGVHPVPVWLLQKHDLRADYGIRHELTTRNTKTLPGHTDGQ